MLTGFSQREDTGWGPAVSTNGSRPHDRRPQAGLRTVQKPERPASSSGPIRQLGAVVSFGLVSLVS